MKTSFVALLSSCLALAALPAGAKTPDPLVIQGSTICSRDGDHAVVGIRFDLPERRRPVTFRSASIGFIYWTAPGHPPIKDPVYSPPKVEGRTVTVTGLVGITGPYKARATANVTFMDRNLLVTQSVETGQAICP